MKFLIDQNFPAFFAEWLADKGLEATHVRDIGMKTVPDMAIISEAVSRGAVIITKDEDFTRGVAAPVIWIRLGNSTNDRLFQVMDEVWTMIMAALKQGQPLIEIGPVRRSPPV